MTSRARRARCVLGAAVAGACLGGTAHAASRVQVVSLGGSPFNVYVGDRGQMQGFLAGQPTGVFFAPAELAGDAGFFLAFPDGASSMGPDEIKGRVYGFEGHAGPNDLWDYTPLGQSPVTGSGTAPDPLTEVTRYATADDVGAHVAEVTQTMSYVNGEGRFRVQWRVKNTSGAPLNFRAFAAADFYYDGDDYGTGVFTPGPPRFIGGTNVDTGRSGGFEEVPSPASPPWTSYETLQYGNYGPDDAVDPAQWRRQLWWIIANSADDSRNVGFADQAVADRVDNAGGVNWDQYRTTALAAGQETSFAILTRAAIPAALTLTPTNAQTAQGAPLTITATSLDTDGRPFVGKTLRWSVTGANPASGQIVLGASGTATITDVATGLGSDTITAFVDLNGDGVAQPNDPTATTGATVVDVTPPACTAAVGPGKPGGAGRKAVPTSAVVTCNEASNLTVAGLLRITTRTKVKSRRKHAKARFKIVRTNVPLATVGGPAPAGQPATLALPIPPGTAKRYAKKKVQIVLTIAATDGAGNAASTFATKTLSLAAYKVASKSKHNKSTHKKPTHKKHAHRR